jgi:PST family polysaccharide transporter
MSSLQSKKQIFKVTSIMGGSSFIYILTGIIRTKILAILLGTSGIGVFGLYTSIVATANTFFDMGLATSGVRQIAEAQGTDNKKKILSVIYALRLCTFILGIAGAISLIVFRNFISIRIFGNSDHALAVGILSVGLFVTVISGSQYAVVNGMRRIGDLAKIQIVGGVLSTVLAVFILYFLKERGIVFYVVSVAVVTFLVTWYFANRIHITSNAFSVREIKKQSRILLVLGLSFMMIAFMRNAVQLYVRSFITKELGLNAAGCFQAATTISILYVSFVIKAMVADYYPRLSSISNDHLSMNKLVNEQLEVALLISGPVILGLLTFVPFVINLLYSSSFVEAIPILRWQVLGTLMQIAIFPIGFIVLAKGKASIMVVSDLAWSIIYLSIIFFGLSGFGLKIVGIAYLIAYSAYFIWGYLIAVKLTGFSLTERNRKHIFFLLLSSIVVFQFYDKHLITSYILGAIITSCFATHTLLMIGKIVKK